MRKPHCERLLISLILLVDSFVAFNQDIGISLMNRDQLYSNRNIAIPYPKKNNFALPEFSGSLLNESGSLNQWLLNTGAGTRTIDLQTLWKSIDRRDYLSQVGWNIQTLAFGKKYNRFQWMVAHKISGDLNFIYNKDLLGILAFGNYGYLQQEPLAKTQALDLKPASEIAVYQSIGVDVAYFLNDHNSIGAGINYLSGWYDFKTDIKKFELDIRDPLAIKANEDWSVRTAHLIDYLSLDSVKVNKKNATWGRHPGMSINLGYSHHTDRMQFGIQVRDLGRIKWKGKQYSRNAITNYSGIRINDLLNIDKGVFDHITDSIKAFTSVDQSDASYSTILPPKIMLDAQYYLSDQWTLGGAIFYSTGSIRPYWKTMLGAEFKPLPFLNIASNVSLDKYHHFDLGLSTSLRVSILHFYLNFSPLPAIWHSGVYNHIAGSAGLSVQWGK